MNHAAKLLITNIIPLLIIIIFSAILSWLGNQILTCFIKVDSANAYIYEMSFFEHLVLSGTVIISIFAYWKCLILLRNILVNKAFSFKAHLKTEILFAIGAYLIFMFSAAALGGGNSVDLNVFKNLFVFFIAAIALPVLQHKMKEWGK